MLVCLRGHGAGDLMYCLSVDHQDDDVTMAEGRRFRYTSQQRRWRQQAKRLGKQRRGYFETSGVTQLEEPLQDHDVAGKSGVQHPAQYLAFLKKRFEIDSAVRVLYQVCVCRCCVGALGTQLVAR